jgi:hypothetical protein
MAGQRIHKAMKVVDDGMRVKKILSANLGCFCTYGLLICGRCVLQLVLSLFASMIVRCSVSP